MSNIVSNNSQNGGLEDYNNISDGIFPHFHYGRFGVRLFIIRQNMNSGIWKKNLAQIVAEYMYFHMVYHTFI